MIMISKTPLEDWILNKISYNGDSSNLGRSAIETFQLEKIKETIAYARIKSPFYKKLLAGAGSNPVKSFQDLSILPFTTSDDLKKQPMQLLCVSQSIIERCVTLQSSATTGSAKRIFFTKEDLEHTLDFFLHGMSTMVKADDRVMILLPGDRPNSVADLLARALLRINVISEKHGFVENPRETVDAIIKNGINCLVGIPVQILSLVRSGNGKERLKNKIKAVLLTTDHVPKAIADVLKTSLNCAVYNHYGMTEMGWGGGVDCEAHCGYHMREADLFIEIIDPETGCILPDGKTGEIVITTLSRHGMPLIRYRTGDISMFYTSNCPCGTILKRIKRIANRVSGVIRLSSDTQITIAQLDEVLFLIPEILDFEVCLSNFEGKNQLVITLNFISNADRNAVAANVKEKIMNMPAIEQSKTQIVIQSKFDHIYPYKTSESRKRTILDNRNKCS